MAEASEDIDPGLAAVAEIWQRCWQLDNTWTEPLPRGFAWYPYRLRHELVASSLFEDLGTRLSRITSRILVVENVRESVVAVEMGLWMLNRQSIASAFVFEREARSIWSVSSMLIHDGTLAWRPALYAALVQIQTAQAEQLVAGGMANAVGGDVATRMHRANGLRPEPDALLKTFRDVFGRTQTKNGFASPKEFREVTDLCSRLALPSSLQESGIAAELVLGQGTARIDLDSSQPHPHFGPGLLVSLRLPGAIERDDAFELATALNEYEGMRGYRTHLQGAWTLDAADAQRYVLVYCGFRPAVLYRPGIIQDEFMALVMRAKFLREELIPDNATPGELSSVLLHRLRKLH
jgi:hypothetical protein